MSFKPTFTTVERSPKNLLQQEQKKVSQKSSQDLATLEEERVYREGVVSIRDLMAPVQNR
jgi:hypothetical protein